MYQFGLIGYPVKHSLSPWIHQHFFKLANLNGAYNLYEIDEKQCSFKIQIEHLKKNLDGFNVTLPYKQKIIPYLDELDITAKQSGAVNTVFRNGDKWVGFNTDGIGYVRSLQDEYPHLFTLKKLKILIIGAGGAARGIFHALAHNSFTSIDFTNRTTKNAREIVRGSELQTNIYSFNNIHNVIEDYDLIIQTTSVGMKPDDKQIIIPLNNVKDGAVVSDIVYQPILTSFLKRANELGAHIHYGHTMLLYQALYSFEIWTNKALQLDDLKNQLKYELEG